MPTTYAAHKVFDGDRFGSLTVLHFSHTDKRWRRHYLCRCDCGIQKTVQGTLLRDGNTRSCGCKAKEAARKRALPHGIAARNQVFAGYRCKAKSASRAFTITIPQFEKLSKSKCFYCGNLPSNVNRSPNGTGDYAYNGLDRIDSRKGYSVNNLVACCRSCNLAKGARSQGEFIEWLRRCVLHLSKTAMADQWG